METAGERSLFYVGTDSALHQVIQTGNHEWRLGDLQNATYWPAADSASAQLAVASDIQNSHLRVYYQSGGKIVELNGDNNAWTTAAAALPNANSTASKSSGSGGSTSSSGSSGASSTGSSSGLSTGAKVGVGVGVSMSVVAIVGILGALFFLRRRQQRHKDSSTLGGSTVVGGSSMAPTPNTGYAGVAYPNYMPQQPQYQQYGGYDQTPHDQSSGWSTYYTQQQHEPSKPGELYTGTPAAVEMPHNVKYHEMVGEGHYREAP